MCKRVPLTLAVEIGALAERILTTYGERAGSISVAIYSDRNGYFIQDPLERVYKPINWSTYTRLNGGKKQRMRSRVTK